MPAGVPGEVGVAGIALARGYLGRPDLTAEKFVPDPWCEAPGERLYKTGDLARFRTDGQVEYLGRLDGQVKIRGFRIELGEVEAVLAQHPEVRGVAVVARDEAVTGARRLVAYLVVEAARVPAVREWLKGRLPDYMVPSAFVALDAPPPSPVGEAQPQGPPPRPQPAAAPGRGRRGAQEPDRGGPGRHLDRSPGARSGDPARRGDDFFAFGGHSLLATRVVSRVRAAFGVDLPLQHPLRILDPLRDGGGHRAKGEPLPAPPIRPLPAGPEIPLSFAQERLWFLDQLMRRCGATYNMPAALRLRGRLDVPAPSPPRWLASRPPRDPPHHLRRPWRQRRPGDRAGPPRRPRPLPFDGLGDLPERRGDREVRRLAPAEANRPSTS